jgi:DNA mismatch endonuclease (patch repair protein)
MHGHHPRSNSNFWTLKLIRNKARDRQVTIQLKKQGWVVIRIWEHSLKRPEQTITRLKNLLSLR